MLTRVLNVYYSSLLLQHLWCHKLPGNVYKNQDIHITEKTTPIRQQYTSSTITNRNNDKNDIVVVKDF